MFSYWLLGNLCIIPLTFQVFALVSRILAQMNPNTRSNVIQKNSSGLSALDYTTVTNNQRLATFLADLYYVMGEDPTCPDISGNTLLHMLARKGDASVDTLRALINLRYSEDGAEKEVSLINTCSYVPVGLIRNHYFYKYCIVQIFH